MNAANSSITIHRTLLSDDNVDARASMSGHAARTTVPPVIIYNRPSGTRDTAARWTRDSNAPSSSARLTCVASTAALSGGGSDDGGISRIQCRDDRPAAASCALLYHRKLQRADARSTRATRRDTGGHLRIIQSLPTPHFFSVFQREQTKSDGHCFHFPLPSPQSSKQHQQQLSYEQTDGR